MAHHKQRSHATASRMIPQTLVHLPTNFELVRHQLVLSSGRNDLTDSSASSLHSYLGHCYMLGRGTRASVREAVVHLVQAVDKGGGGAYRGQVERAQWALVQLALAHCGESPSASAGDHDTQITGKRKRVLGNGSVLVRTAVHGKSLMATVEAHDDLAADDDFNDGAMDDRDERKSDSVGDSDSDSESDLASDSENDSDSDSDSDSEFHATLKKRARAYAQHLAENEGHLEAQRLLARLYLTGHRAWSLTMDLPKSIRYMRMAIDQWADVGMMRMLAGVLLSGEHEQLGDDQWLREELGVYLDDDDEEDDDDEKECGDATDTDTKDSDPDSDTTPPFIPETSTTSLRTRIAMRILRLASDSHSDPLSTHIIVAFLAQQEQEQKQHPHRLRSYWLRHYATIGVTQHEDALCLRVLIAYYHQRFMEERDAERCAEAEMEARRWLRVGAERGEQWCVEALAAWVPASACSDDDDDDE